ncbi:branched-chain amino acid ABC transporter substrate-binding protein [Paenibacillus turpanensis]|uniref:branched-chain amino acid ABC transporter substrate-binding protein n=1 Tax=Paenibacillus turpanensis TaxID=2689078 RepID=UPI00140E04D0|nr:branched-chain amino acid ABC transporter substrate-binding protein [Paenibacillus turpanensis]
MKKKTTFRLLCTVGLLTGLISGCSTGGSQPVEEPKPASAVPAPAPASTALPETPVKMQGTLKVAVQSPLSGSIATLGESIKLGAQLALEEKVEAFKSLGFTLELVPYDDQADPKKGVANAQVIGADTSIVGIIGHLNSGVSIPASETYEKYNLAMISPASTATDFTDRNLQAAHRIVARDDFQGPAGAEFAVKTLGAKTIFVIQDKTAYGQGLATAFRDAAEKLGATIAGYEGITVGEKDFNGVLNQVTAKKPDLIYFGGMYSEGGLIIKQAREKNISVPIMGGDGMDSSGLIEIAGESAVNTYYTSVAADISKVDSGKSFVEKYIARYGKNVESYSVYSYDAMGVMLKAIENAIAANSGKMPTREQVRDAVREIQDYQGVVTKVGFDEKGDNNFAKVYIFKFEKAAYPGTQTGEVSK